MVWGSDRVREVLAACGVELAEGACEARLEGHLTRRSDKVLLRGEAQARYWVPCSRCLEPAVITVAEPALQLCFVPPNADCQGMGQGERDGGAGLERELEGEDLEVSTHDGVRIDLEGLLRELLVLALPIAPCCGEGCPGPDVPEAMVEAGHEAPAWSEALARLKS